MKSTIIRKTGILLAMMLTLHITATGSESKPIKPVYSFFAEKKSPNLSLTLLRKKPAPTPGIRWQNSKHLKVKQHVKHHLCSFRL